MKFKLNTTYLIGKYQNEQFPLPCNCISPLPPFQSQVSSALTYSIALAMTINFNFSRAGEWKIIRYRIYANDPIR
jgi:hypothetical protein